MSSDKTIVINMTKSEARSLIEGIDILRQSDLEFDSIGRNLESIALKVGPKLAGGPRMKRPLKFSRKNINDTPLGSQ